ncbi:3D domain-containing protein [Veillonella agrestimuris]|uniref:3D domain-containing protein n=1 Tax=Veillonella agrestimuris TaxID=2941340 RepID=UPI00203ECFEE|nr:3D domain-containing protein [Veillonella agrestimuris]
MIRKIVLLGTLCFLMNMMAFAHAAVISKGQQGHHVQKLQTMLAQQGFLKDSADGVFGTRTEAAVKKFQKSKGLAVDGRVGPATMKALEKYETTYTEAMTTKDRSGVPKKYVKVMTMHASAYSSQDPGNGNYTATGARLKKGIVAVDPNVIPLGTRLYIEGYGYAVAEDVGGAIKGTRIDLAFEKRSEALHFGRQTVKVYIL